MKFWGFIILMKYQNGENQKQNLYQVDFESQYTIHRTYFIHFWEFITLYKRKSCLIIIYFQP